MPRCGLEERKGRYHLNNLFGGFSLVAARWRFATTPRRGKTEERRAKLSALDASESKPTKENPNSFDHTFKILFLVLFPNVGTAGTFGTIGTHGVLSSNHFIRPRQHIRRYREADLLGGFQIDDEFKLRRLFDGEVCWIGAL